MNTSPIAEYHKFELAEVFKRAREISSLRVSVFVFFGTVSLSVLGVAYNTQKVSLVLIAAGTLGLLIASDWAARQQLNVILFRGILLENKYSPDSESSLVHNFVRGALTQRNYLKVLMSIAGLKTAEERAAALRAFRFSTFGFWIPLVLIVVYLILGYVLWAWFGWKIA